MSKTTDKSAKTRTAVIGGKTVKVATPAETKAAATRAKQQFSGALENLKNR